MTQTMSQVITDKLTRRIVNERYLAGTKLPTERELAAEFGVTRHVVREALKRLEAVGLVSIRQGSGITVEDLKLTGGVELFDSLIKNDDGSINLPLLRDVMEFRGDIVRSIVRLAAMRRTPEQMADLKRLTEERLSKKGDREELEKVNFKLFELVTEAAHNEVYHLVFNTVGRIFLKLRKSVDVPVLGFEETELLVERLVEAFEQKDADMADLLVTRHLRIIQRSLRPEEEVGASS